MNQQQQQPQPPYGSQMGWGGQDGQMNAYGQGWNPSMQQQQQPQQPTDQSKHISQIINSITELLEFKKNTSMRSY